MVWLKVLFLYLNKVFFFHLNPPRPFLAHIKAKQKKEIREREKNEQSSETPSRSAVKKERRNR